MPREKEDLLRENERLRATCEKAQEERLIYARLHALTGSFLVVYVVDPETDRYREFSATDDYVESFAQAKDGTDFFGTVRKAAVTYNHPDDLERFLSVFTKENVMAARSRSTRKRLPALSIRRWSRSEIPLTYLFL